MIFAMFGDIRAPFLLKYREVTKMLLDRENGILEIMERAKAQREQAELMATPSIKQIATTAAVSMSTVQNVKRVMQNTAAHA